jgi:hypothetical protein
MRLDPFKKLLAKIVQLYETCEIRHGIMVLEHSESGKTCITNALIKALCDEPGPYRLYKMNPKLLHHLKCLIHFIQVRVIGQMESFHFFEFTCSTAFLSK